MSTHNVGGAGQLDREAMISRDEAAAMSAVARVLEGNGDERVQIVRGSEGADLPEPVARLLLDLVEGLSAGQSVEFAWRPRVVDLAAAARVLNVPEKLVVRFLDEGKLFAVIDGSGRQLFPMDDLVDFKRRWTKERHHALDRLTQLNQDLGLYTDQS